MKSKLLSVGILAMMTLGFLVYIPSVRGAAPITTTSVNPCFSNLCSSPSPQNFTFNGSVFNKTSLDLGPFQTQTATNGFIFSTLPNDFMMMGLPKVGENFLSTSSVFYNSTITEWQLSILGSSVNVFFKPSQYQSKISIQVNMASPQMLCLPFSSQNPIVQQNASIRGGNEVFSWRDIPRNLNPSWNGSLCMLLPMGITNIDPIALDGSGQANWSGGTSKACSLTTTKGNDVIIIMATGSPTNTLNSGQWSVSDTSTLSWFQRGFKTIAGVNGLVITWFYAIASSALSGDTITISESGASIAIFNGQVVCFGVSGANTSTPFDANAAIPCTNTAGTNPYSCTISTSNANDFLFGGVVEAGGGGLSAPNAGGSWTDISNIVNTYSNDASYLIVSSTQSSSAVTWFGDAGNQFVAGVDAIQQGASIQPMLFVLKVNPSPSPDGGMIQKNVVGVVTISSSTTVTVSSSTQFVIGAVAFSAYIWNGWNGATTFIQDTINPTQTASITATANSTETSTLTANFAIPASSSPPNYEWLILLPFIMIAIVLAARRR